MKGGNICNNTHRLQIVPESLASCICSKQQKTWAASFLRTFVFLESKTLSASAQQRMTDCVVLPLLSTGRVFFFFPGSQPYAITHLLAAVTRARRVRTKIIFARLRNDAHERCFERSLYCCCARMITSMMSCRPMILRQQQQESAPATAAAAFAAVCVGHLFFVCVSGEGWRRGVHDTSLKKWWSMLI